MSQNRHRFANNYVSKSTSYVGESTLVLIPTKRSNTMLQNQNPRTCSQAMKPSLLTLLRSGEPSLLAGAKTSPH
nr:hypothetical protein Q903MT_gene3637 [Picea sitchensis]